MSSAVSHHNRVPGNLASVEKKCTNTYNKAVECVTQHGLNHPACEVYGLRFFSCVAAELCSPMTVYEMCDCLSRSAGDHTACRESFLRLRGSCIMPNFKSSRAIGDLEHEFARERLRITADDPTNDLKDLRARETLVIGEKFCGPQFFTFKRCADSGAVCRAEGTFLERCTKAASRRATIGRFLFQILDQQEAFATRAKFDALLAQSQRPAPVRGALLPPDPPLPQGVPLEARESANPNSERQQAAAN
eukprot:gnl/Spiro4/940_TR492_c0_g1_i1.p1 gnl/Spiro4/940_TR492_c0_g1~~gnl/Spiro4/940_TR492_c0_g1_i1.p1  ORF type:complete len:248 (+),score=33.79 gnl/Spiro4/940_TR492_c0_g1_i1:80-823(+)